jgi:hypothetical protein
MESIEQNEGQESLTSHERGEQFNAELIQQSVEALAGLEALRPEVWEQLSIEERLEAIQEIENRLAETSQREAVEVLGETMEPGTLGYWDGHAIHINREVVANSPVDQVVNVVVHEGRHAYQEYVLKVHPELYPDLEAEVAWLLNSPPFGFYFDAATYGFEIYRAQPLEADAWSFGETVTNQLYGPQADARV